MKQSCMGTSLRVKQTLATTTVHVHVDLRAWETSGRGQQQRGRVLVYADEQREAAHAAARAEALRAFSASADRLIKVWDLDTFDQLASLAGHQSFVCALQTTDTCLYSASSDKTLAVWSLDTYARLAVLTGHRGGLYSLAVHAGRACSGSLDGTIRVWPDEGERPR